ncbi:MAG TPA: hypothetical protein DD723_10590 [Candidatus Omnitrophica bacterium]|nr:MAG: hypothetical protein A2Z81_09760 [Omnitrophica WOR_2 bacterium GWA2_45_18]OGX19924.1 MAG: hypothetical protein A2Y04_04245 [Omnitrophica WOR_2 bacterium GWC2_45_7]HBR15964.1 hypothetical protein [Candidatus Omnitrophota bacterium]
MKKYIYDRFEFTKKYHGEVVEFIKHNTNVEIGGYRIFDGIGTHLMQSPYEFADFIFALKKYEKDSGKKLRRFLDVGFSAGINNTLINKFFNFEEIVALDIFAAQINGFTLKGNLTHKNLTLVCGDSTSQRVLNIVKALGTYDFIFIDANHTYEFVKKDFENYKTFLNKGGVIGFHDVDCPDWPGINKFWNELKATGLYHQQEFVCRDYLLQYGIGMLTLKS